MLQRQVQGLKALYDATDGANWNLQGQSDDSTEVTIPWSFTIPQENQCSTKWYGVKCSSSEIITSLSLHRKGLAGTLPSEIGRLSELTFLDISSNAIVGSLVPQLFALATLRHLDLGSNLIQGSIPSYVERLSALTSLWLHSNSLTGELPSALFSLTQLDWTSFLLSGRDECDRLERGSGFSGLIGSTDVVWQAEPRWLAGIEGFQDARLVLAAQNEFEA